LVQKTSDFSKFMIRSHGQEGSGGDQIFAILCGRLHAQPLRIMKENSLLDSLTLGKESYTNTDLITPGIELMVSFFNVKCISDQ